MDRTGAEVLVEQLIREGVGKLFGVPGVQLDWATDALRKEQSRIDLLVPKHEQTTSYMADGYSRVTGRVGACMVVPGPGLLNAMAGLSTAYACNSRVLCISGNIHSSGIGKGAGLLHEINNQTEILGSVTKWNRCARRVEEIPELVNEAVRQLNTGRPQPVGLEISHDLLAASTRVENVDPVGDNIVRPPVDDAALARAAALLDEAKFPVIYVGGGVLAAGASLELRAFAEKIDAPVVMSENGRGALSDEHPLALNAVGGRAVFEHADVALIVGSRFVDTSSGAPILPASRIKYIYLNVDAEVAGPPKSAEVTVVADAKAGLAALAAAVKAKSVARCDDVSKVKKWVLEQTQKIQPQSDWLTALRGAIPKNGVLVNELTQVGYFARSHFPVYEPNTFITPGYQGTLGYGFPTALGAAVGCPDRAVVSITGDGGFGWNLQELATAARYQLNVAVVVFNDGRFGNVRTLQMQQFGNSFGDTIYNPAFSKLAEAFAVRYDHATDPASLHEKLSTALRTRGPILIEVPVEAMPSPWHLMRLTSPPFPQGTPANPLGSPAAT